MVQFSDLQSTVPTTTSGQKIPFLHSYAAYSDYSSSGIQQLKLKESLKNEYNISPDCMSNTSLINTVLQNNAMDFLTKSRNVNNNGISNGYTGTSSLIPSISSYNSSNLTINSLNSNSPGSQDEFARPKNRMPAYLNSDGTIDIQAMKNTGRPTKNINGKTYFADTPNNEELPNTLFASPGHNYAAMPKNPNGNNTDSTISILPGNNSIIGQSIPSDIRSIINNDLVNNNGFTSLRKTVLFKNLLQSKTTTLSGQNFVNSLNINSINGGYYLLPSFS
jgi:hypothetical protein